MVRGRGSDEVNRDKHWCQDCRRVVKVDVHGRCAKCGSEAVTVENEMEDEEELYAEAT